MNRSGTTALVTGSAGWLGAFLRAEMAALEIDVVGLDLNPGRVRDVDCVCDLAAGVPELPRPVDAVYHLAGLAHRRPRNDADAERFFAVNVDGTRNLLTGLERLERLPQALVFVSTVAVYGLDQGEGVREDQARRAEDPYGLSKRMAEDLLTEWGSKRNVAVTIIRPPLVAGPGAPGNLGALLNAMKAGRYLSIGGGRARRSMVCVDELSRGMIELSGRDGAYHLTDGRHPSFRELEDAFAERLGIGRALSLPRPVARALALGGDLGQRLLRRELMFDRQRYLRMSSTLTFDDARARRDIAWTPTPVPVRADWILSS